MVWLLVYQFRNSSTHLLTHTP
uniref:Uncharacterized protein n=1 Tax=Anguilla anguilla TaxID=7936 RepID=A0A0E9QWV2_ANGAN